MPTEMIVAILVMYALIFALYVPVLMRIRARRRARATAARFCRGVVSILEATANDQAAYPQVRTLHKTLKARYHVENARQFASVTSALEDLMTHMDSSAPDDFQQELGLDAPRALRNRINLMLQMARSDEPFADLTSKQAHLLTTLTDAVTTANVPLAKTAIAQLKDEVRFLEDGLISQKSQTQWGFIFSAVGALLTLFFGAVSFIQFLVQ